MDGLMPQLLEQHYYTPIASDLYIGYECEAKAGYSTLWVRWIFGSIWDMHMITDGRVTLDGVLRVPYLTRAQIEAEEWTYRNEGGNYILFEKEGWTLTYWPFDGMEVRVEMLGPKYPKGNYVKCSCPSINEFRKVWASMQRVVPIRGNVSR